jgi:hypothetical protein
MFCFAKIKGFLYYLKNSQFSYFLDKENQSDDDFAAWPSEYIAML